MPWRAEKNWNIRSRPTHELAYSPGGGKGGVASPAPPDRTGTQG